MSLPIILSFLLDLGLDIYLFMDVVCDEPGVFCRVCGVRCDEGMVVSDL